MISFAYKAKTATGETTIGEVQSPTRELAVELLRRRKLFVISIKATTPSIFSRLAKMSRRPGLDDIVAFTRQLATMSASGLPLTDALRILKTQSNQSMSDVISDVLENVEGGSSLADSLAKHKNIFSQVYVALVRAGESAGVLDNILNRLAVNLEKQKAFVGKVKGAMIYPVIVIIAMVVVGMVMMIFVVPKLTQMYQTFNVQLPLPTKILMGASDWLIKYWILVFGFFGLAAASFSAWVKTPAGRTKFELAVFRIPVMGKLQKQIALTEITRTIGLLVGAGISIIDALKITAAAVKNSIYQNALLVAASQVEKGMPLSVPMAQNPHFPPILSQMVNVGEETGRIDDVLTKLSLYFETESEQAVSALTAAIEPLIMICLGIGVGFLVIAVILPIYNLTSAF